MDALSLVPAGEPVFAAVSPGNARSLRAFLAVGFYPIRHGGEVKPYSMDFLVALGLIALAVEWLRAPGRDWPLWALAGLGPLVIGVSHGLCALPPLVAKTLALGASVVTNFLLYRYVVWSPARVTPSPRRAGPVAAREAARR